MEHKLLKFKELVDKNIKLEKLIEISDKPKQLDYEKNFI